MTEIKSTDKQTAQINTDAIPPITSRFPDRVSTCIYGNSPDYERCGLVAVRGRISKLPLHCTAWGIFLLSLG